MDEREAKVIANLESAATAKADAEKEKLHFQTANQELERQASEMLQKAKIKADNNYLVLKEEAQAEVQRKQEAWYSALAKEQEEFLQALEIGAQQEVVNIARQALTDLSDADLEERIVAVFLNKWQEFVQGKSREEITGYNHNLEKRILIRSAWPLTDMSHQTIEEALRQTMAKDVEINFVLAPDLIGGIELVANGQKVSWTVAQYLSSLRQNMMDILERKNHANASRK